MPNGPLFAVGTGNSVNTPDGVRLATLLPVSSVNQSLPASLTMSQGPPLAVGTSSSVMGLGGASVASASGPPSPGATGGSTASAGASTSAGASGIRSRAASSASV